MTAFDAARLEREADRSRVRGVDVIECPDCEGSGFDPTTIEVDVRDCQLCEGHGCIRESDLAAQERR